MDYRVVANRVEFMWNGSCEYDEMSGRGFVEIYNGELRGHFYIHLGG